jgi:hypothetical protein
VYKIEANMKIRVQAWVVATLLLAGGLPVYAQPGSSPKGDKSKKGAGPTDSSSAPSSGSAFWVTPQVNPCSTRNKKAVVFTLLPAAGTKTQPYFVKLQEGELPTFYAGEPLSIAVIATEDEIKEIPMINFAVDASKADPLNVAPVRPSQSTTSAAADTKPKYFCLVWPQKMIGDTIPKITLTAIYKGPKPDPADPEPNISLGVVSLPQVHVLYHYNVATGVIVSTLRNPTFSRVQTALPSNGNPAQYKTVKDDGNLYVAPALFFTAYLLGPMDAESGWKCDWKNLRPQPSLGFSLSSPADNFFFGFSSEVRRNVQLVYGYHLGKINKLSPALVIDPTSSAAPATVQRYNGGFYGGLTFNIDFIKGLFSGK